MPRVGPFRELNRETLTPFARLIYDYMVSQTPTLLVSELSAESGISNNAIWSWLKHGIIPRRQTIVQLTERVLLPDGTPVFDLDELLTAAGWPTTRQLQRERLAHLDMLRASLDEVMALVNADPAFTESDRAAIAKFLRQKPDEFIQATNTWREFHHESPMDWQMRQSEEHAAVYEPDPIATPEDAHDQPRFRRHRADRSQSGRTTDS